MSSEPYLPSSPEYIAGSPSRIRHAGIPWLVPSGKPAETEMPVKQQILHSTLSCWCASIWKRAFDLLCIIPGLILVSPVLGVITIAVRVTSPGPVIFRQQRVGKNRKLFTIYKFRTMVENSEAMGPGHTAKGDPRVTSVGRVLRRFKLDELPQLYNVLRGDMSLVGPRPKLPNHDPAPMACRPGVTGAATLAFRHEARILSEIPAEGIEGFYQQYIIPHKLRLDSQYMERATVFSDISVLIATVLRAGDHLTHADLLSSNSMTLFLSEPVHLRAEERLMGARIHG
ncbi:MAG TPA: sugar transferase, partial [Acidobacteriaceae bacterium]|nr:sugar transferase [Acidobacteriaceae bacterium]